MAADSQQPLKSTEEINSCFQDLSFSSYLKPNTTIPGINPINDDAEISIFEAQKYFSEADDLKDVKKLDPGFGRNFRSRSNFKITTPTVSSEASWNSQTGLLKNPPGAVGSVFLKNFPADGCKKRSSAAKKWFLIPNSCCIGKKTVRVKEAEPEMINSKPAVLINIIKPENPKPCNNNLSSVQAPWQHSRKFLSDGAVGAFSFPILNHQAIMNKQLPRPLREDEEEKEGSPCKSLEVFQAMRAHFINPGTNMDDDDGSDASSDLFEIESLSTPNSYGIPVTPCAAASECYAPSEVSIDWSVTTAEGFDKASSVTSFSINNIGLLRENAGVAKRKTGNGLLLMGCRPEGIKCVADGPTIFPLHGKPQQANKPPIAASNEARLSLAFAA